MNVDQIQQHPSGIVMKMAGGLGSRHPYWLEREGDRMWHLHSQPYHLLLISRIEEGKKERVLMPAFLVDWSVKETEFAPPPCTMTCFVSVWYPALVRVTVWVPAATFCTVASVCPLPTPSIKIAAPVGTDVTESGKVLTLLVGWSVKETEFSSPLCTLTCFFVSVWYPALLRVTLWVPAATYPRVAFVCPLGIPSIRIAAPPGIDVIERVPVPVPPPLKRKRVKETEFSSPLCIN